MAHFFVHLWWVTTSVTNAFYGMMSGWVGDVSILVSAITGLTVYYKHTRCHVDERDIGGKNCRKHGKYPFQHFKVCKNHHPAVPKKITHLHIIKLHKNSLDKHEP